MRNLIPLRLVPSSRTETQKLLDPTPEIIGPRKDAHFTTWRTSVLYGSIAAIFTLVANVFVLVWAKSSLEDVEDGVATAFEGSCETTKSITLWCHLGINVVSTILLAACNYCCQILAAPTRKNILKAHSTGKWMDIGVQSIRNLSMISVRRVLLWCTLLASSIPLHLFYNSVLFTTRSANTYIVAFVTDYFVRGAWFKRPQTNDHNWHGSYVASRLGVLQHSVDTLRRLEMSECMQVYDSSSFQSAWGDVLFVNKITNHSHVLLDVGLRSPGDSFNVNGGLDHLLEESEYCLAKSTKEHCEVRLDLTLLWIVIACNALTAACLITTFLLRRFDPLATIGDAIASFMNDPEPLTAERGPIAAADIRGKDTESWHSVFAQRTLMPWRNERRQWVAAVPWRVCMSCIALCLSILIAASTLLGVGLPELYNNHTNSSSVVADFAAFAESNDVSRNSLLSSSVDVSPTALLLISNLPQLIVSCLYLLYNNLFTHMLLGREFSRFAKIRQFLRVTAPQGQQRSIYWLTLPYHYTLPMMTVFALLHLSVSRGLFVVQISEYNDPRHPNGVTTKMALSWSPLPMVVTICIVGVLMLALVIFGMRKLDSGIPLVGSCSLAISAAANAGANEKDAALKPAMYGSIPEALKEGQFKRTGLSSREVEKLINGEIYI